jgi:hypothetical protein
MHAQTLIRVSVFLSLVLLWALLGALPVDAYEMDNAEDPFVWGDVDDGGSSGPLEAQGAEPPAPTDEPSPRLVELLESVAAWIEARLGGLRELARR